MKDLDVNFADSFDVLGVSLGDVFFHCNEEVRLGCSANCFRELALFDPLVFLDLEQEISGRRDEDGTERFCGSLP